MVMDYIVHLVFLILIIVNPLLLLFLYYKSASPGQMYLRKALLDPIGYVCTFALLYLIWTAPTETISAIDQCLEICGGVGVVDVFENVGIEFVGKFRHHRIVSVGFPSSVQLRRAIPAKHSGTRIADVREMHGRCGGTVELVRVPTSAWNTIGMGMGIGGACRSSNRGFNVEQFYQVTMCDPFRPDHLSVRERSPLWYTIVIWRMSLINNGQWKVHEFDFNYDMEEEQELLGMFAGGPSCFVFKLIYLHSFQLYILESHICEFIKEKVLSTFGVHFEKCWSTFGRTLFTFRHGLLDCVVAV